MFRVGPDVVLILEVYAKKTRAIPQEVIDRCKKRLKDYEQIARKVVKKPASKNKLGN